MNEDVILVTADTGPRLKARSMDIRCLTLPLDLLLPSEETETDIKIKKLTVELHKLKNCRPDVNLFISDK